ncbi:NAD-dependent epimerase/dehydratase family protein [Nonlabens antarcticus]|uniref:NAD-dependent epimerase/dehydratase family protein n=1 Tax=Nonlabens antarcticus TaxID=392714 RepID=UPI00189156D6|nr:NAD-dependent epimerase/dehydratase family protein [Nonlabens antarcticus]
MNKIIISGASGFVGQNLIPYLEGNGLNVIALSRESKVAKTITYDGISIDNWNNASTFVHLAGKAHDLKKTSDDSAYFEVNRDLTIKLFNQFLKSDCSTFIFMSSVKAAADEVEGVLEESYIPDPQTPYGKSKREAEEYLLAQNLPHGKNLYILRPCMIHGSGNKGNLNLLYQVVKNGIPYPLGIYENKRSFLSIQNLNIIIAAFIKQQPASGIYHIADDEPISTSDLIRLIGAVLKKKPMILNVPKPVMQGLSRLGGMLKAPFDTNALQKLTESYVVSNKKVKESLNITQPWDTIAGLKKTIESFDLK